jgi:hypothetical protein
MKAYSRLRALMKCVLLLLLNLSAFTRLDNVRVWAEYGGGLRQRTGILWVNGCPRCCNQAGASNPLGKGQAHFITSAPSRSLNDN